MAATVSAFALAMATRPPIQYVFVLAGVVLGLAWLVGVFISNYFRRRMLKEMLSALGTSAPRD
jgi:hypothetical protein